MMKNSKNNPDLAVYRVAAKAILGRRLCNDRGIEWPEDDFEWMGSRHVQAVLDEVRPYITDGLTAVWLTCLHEENVSIKSERAEDILLLLYESMK